MITKQNKMLDEKEAETQNDVTEFPRKAKEK